MAEALVQMHYPVLLLFSPDLFHWFLMSHSDPGVFLMFGVNGRLVYPCLCCCHTIESATGLMESAAGASTLCRQGRGRELKSHVLDGRNERYVWKQFNIQMCHYFLMVVNVVTLILFSVPIYFTNLAENQTGNDN